MKVWAEETLGDLCSLITDGKHGDCRNEDNSGYYFISCKDVREGRIHYENARQIVQGDFAETHRRTDLRPGDILLTNSGTIGRLAIAPDDEKTQRTTFQKSVAILKPLPETITSQFLYYSLAADRDRLINSAGGAAQKNLLLGELRRFPIRVAPIAEQAEIASILSAYDNLIENNRRRIQLLEDSARLLYREWFVRFLFPGHEYVKIIDGVPEGWEKRHLSELVDTQYGFTETANPCFVGPKFLRGTDINKTTYIDWSTVPYCPDNNLDFSKYALKPGDIVVIRMADPGKVAIIEKDIKAVFASYLVRLTLKGGIEIPPLYLFYVLSDDSYQGFIHGASGGSTRKSASAKLLVDFNLIAPSQSLVSLFVEKVKPIRKQIGVLLDQNASLRFARDLLLPRLMNGEIKV